MSKPSIGVIYRPQLTPEDFSRAVAVAQDEGIEQVWLWEDCFLQGGLTTAAVGLAQTTSTIFGLGLMPVPLRNVALAAMEMSALERMFPGRFRLALGHGVQDWMGQVGARVESPMTLMREYLSTFSQLMRGETVNFSGRYVSLNRVALDWPPAAAPPVLMGATGPRSLALAGELADGVVLTEDSTAEVVESSLAICRKARNDAGKSPDFDAVVYLRAYTGPNSKAQMAAEERPGALGAGIAGNAAEVAERVMELAEAGATTVCLLPPAVDCDASEYFTWVAREVNELVRS